METSSMDSQSGRSMQFKIDHFTSGGHYRKDHNLFKMRCWHLLCTAEIVDWWYFQEWANIIHWRPWISTANQTFIRCQCQENLNGGSRQHFRDLAVKEKPSLYWDLMSLCSCYLTSSKGQFWLYSLPSLMPQAKVNMLPTANNFVTLQQ